MQPSLGCGIVLVMKDIAKAVVYTGIFLVPAIVLIIANSFFFPFITGKNFAFRIIVEIIFCAWIILALYEPEYRPRWSWILGSFAGLLVVMFFANLFGESPFQSFWSNFERMEGYVTLVHTFLYLVVVGSVMKTQKLWDRFFMTNIAVAIILSFYAFAQLSGSIVINQGGVRLDGTLGNAAYMAIYSLFLIFITAYMFLRAQSTGMRVLYGALIILFLYLLVQTETRGTSIGLAGGAIISTLYIALFNRSQPMIRKIALGTFVGVVLIIGGLWSLKDTSFVQDSPPLARITNITLAEAANRFNIWQMAFEGVKERPILGWGQGNYNYVFNTYYRPELHGGESWFDRVHNIVMDWLIAGGIVGAVAYFSILISAVYYLFVRPLLQDDDVFTVWERGILLGLLAGYTIHNMLVFDNIVSYIFYGTILAFIHSRVGIKVPKIQNWRIDTRVVDQIAAPVVIVALFVIVYVVNVPSILAARDIIDGFRAETPEAMLASFERALGRNSFGAQEIREQMTQRVQSLLQEPEVSPDVKNRAIQRVEEELLKQIEEKPGDARAHVFVASFYRLTGNVDKAIAQLEIARSLSPNKQLIIYEQGFAQLQKGEYAKATEFFKEAYDLAPQFSESLVLYAMSEIYNGHPERVNELIVTEGEKAAFASNNNAVQAAYKAKMYPLLIEMFTIQIQRSPQNTDARTNLAYILSETGDKAGAIEVLRTAIEEIPSYRVEGEAYIQSLELNESAPQSTGPLQP